MGFLDRWFGTRSSAPPATADTRAIERYRYLLRTAPPEAIEQAHAEAFAQLTPEQRAEVLRGLSDTLPESERGTALKTEPQALARVATRAELRQPGTMERLFGGRPGAMGGGIGGVGMGGMLAGTLLSTIAGTVIGSAIAHQFFGSEGDSGADADAHGDGTADNAQDDSQAEAADGESGGDDFGGEGDMGGGGDFEF